MYLPGLAGEHIGPLHHDNSHKVRRLGIEDGLSGVGNVGLADVAVGVEDIEWEHEVRDVSAINAGTVHSTEIQLVVDG